MMTYFVGLDVSQKMTAICVVDNAGLGLSRGQCPTPPEQIEAMVRRHAGDDFRIGIKTGAMTPWLVQSQSPFTFRQVRLTTSLPTSPAKTALSARHTRLGLVPAR